MDYIGVLDMFKIGIGPSSSHTLGPWRAAQQFVNELVAQQLLTEVKYLRVDLYGSLSLTGKGHATDYACLLGLSGYDPVTMPVHEIMPVIGAIDTDHVLNLGGVHQVPFQPLVDIVFHIEFLPFHPNGVRFTAIFEGDKPNYESTFYSVGGGFIVKEGQERQADEGGAEVPYPIYTEVDWAAHEQETGLSRVEIVRANEHAVRTPQQLFEELRAIWQTMLECAYIGCHTEGNLPGGLNVRRRAFDMHAKLAKDLPAYTTAQEWVEAIRSRPVAFRDTLKWVSCFALAVNEVNASLGRVVTAPTNGSAGVIPSVLLYYIAIAEPTAAWPEIERFLLMAGAVGSLFKRGATISAAMGGCQAEIGVSSAMAAAGLCEVLGGSGAQCMMAAEIAMEHHLGLTCDPVAGLVQVPCIERNAMGAIKAIQAAELALESDPQNAKVSLDKVIATLWQTAQDMNTKYKETSEAGLAVAVSIADC